MCLMEGVAKRLGGAGEIIEEKQVKTGVNFFGFFDAFLPGGELSTPVSL